MLIYPSTTVLLELKLLNLEEVKDPNGAAAVGLKKIKIYLQD